jgi:hypothetical protein
VSHAGDVVIEVEMRCNRRCIADPHRCLAFRRRPIKPVLKIKIRQVDRYRQRLQCQRRRRRIREVSQKQSQRVGKCSADAAEIHAGHRIVIEKSPVYPRLARQPLHLSTWVEGSQVIRDRGR